MVTKSARRLICNLGEFRSAFAKRTLAGVARRADSISIERSTPTTAPQKGASPIASSPVPQARSRTKLCFERPSSFASTGKKRGA
jgi:hypothetical protein